MTAALARDVRTNEREDSESSQSGWFALVPLDQLVARFRRDAPPEDRTRLCFRS